MAERKIKYDGSQEEEIALGFVTPEGIAVNAKRYEYTLYRKEVDRRKKYKANPDLIKAKIVSKDGEVLNEAELQRYETMKHNAIFNKMFKAEEEKMMEPTGTYVALKKIGNNVKRLFTRKQQIASKNTGKEL